MASAAANFCRSSASSSLCCRASFVRRAEFLSVCFCLFKFCFQFRHLFEILLCSARFLRSLSDSQSCSFQTLHFVFERIRFPVEIAPRFVNERDSSDQLFLCLCCCVLLIPRCLSCSACARSSASATSASASVFGCPASFVLSEHPQVRSPAAFDPDGVPPAATPLSAELTIAAHAVRSRNSKSQTK